MTGDGTAADAQDLKATLKDAVAELMEPLFPKTAGEGELKRSLLRAVDEHADGVRCVESANERDLDRTVFAALSSAGYGWIAPEVSLMGRRVDWGAYDERSGKIVLIENKMALNTDLIGQLVTCVGAADEIVGFCRSVASGRNSRYEMMVAAMADLGFGLVEIDDCGFPVVVLESRPQETTTKYKNDVVRSIHEKGSRRGGDLGIGVMGVTEYLLELGCARHAAQRIREQDTLAAVVRRETRDCWARLNLRIDEMIG